MNKIVALWMGVLLACLSHWQPKATMIDRQHSAFDIPCQCIHFFGRASEGKGGRNRNQAPMSFRMAAAFGLRWVARFSRMRRIRK